ncbi:MAG: endonuclease MutS2 [Clostridia bacterium]|nr:endonuclease MutS2 [Clostridia bacterium]
MLYTDKIGKTLEFDKIRQLLADCALTEGAKELALRLTPTDDADEVIRRQRWTTDACRLIRVKGLPTFGMVKDVGPAGERAEKGAVLSPRELLDIANVLRTCRMMLDYIHSRATENSEPLTTSLDEIFERLIPDRPLEEKITRSIIAEDMIADEASRELAEIRRKIRAANARIKELLQKYTGGVSSRYLQENIVTMRNGRYVVPVKSEYKNEVKGLIHDTSSSGATMFIEPIAVVDANNELRMLESRETHEIERILAELSASVAEMSHALWLNYLNITELAFIFACGQLSIRLNAVSPRISRGRDIRFIRARHPLIDPEKVVPINVTIGDGYDTLIITGPNTGGKTVTLKTLGLFALMTQSGLHIPVDGESTICLFDRVLVDLGDDQSIEQSLSTFSSHMVNIVSMIEQLNDRSLVLFDELGAGTDPVEGAALAMSIIEAVRHAGAICAATTHYAELKAYALNTEGVQNASCEFDVETLRPTYKLIIGTPGKSNAFAISEKLGIPSEIIRRAQHYVSAENRNFESVIEKLEKARVEMEKNKEESARLRKEYEAFKAESEQKMTRALKQAEKELEVAKARAVAMVESAKASSDFILEQADKVRRAQETARLGEQMEESRRAIRAHLRENEDSYNPVEERRVKDYVLPRPLKKGDEVYIVNIDKNGFLVDDPDKSGNVNVQAGIIRMRTKVKNLQLIENKTTVIDKNKQKKSVNDYKASLVRDFTDEIDLRGKTGEEAWAIADKYLDDAALAGLKTVRLIHGKGTGALKAALWKILQKDKRVASFRIGMYGEGDGGVTVVELK